MSGKKWIKCEFCNKKVKKTNYLQHKSKVHPRQLLEDECDMLRKQFRGKEKKFREIWTGSPEEVIAEIRQLKATTIEMHAEKAALLEWTTRSLCADLYWIKPIKQIEDYEYNMALERLRKIELKHPLWVKHLECGGPSYYGVLGVTIDASATKIKEQYNMKQEFYSTYPTEILDDAMKTLRNKNLREEYNTLMDNINILNKGLSSKEKKGIIKEHDSWIKDENTEIIMKYIKQEHAGWEMVFRFGAPTFYEILGVERWCDGECDKKEIRDALEIRKSLYPNAGELIDDISIILLNPILYWEYEFMLSYLEECMEDGDMHDVERRREVWKIWYDKWNIILFFLSEQNKAYEKFQKWVEIINKHNDWEPYLPPNEQSLYNVLNIEQACIYSNTDNFTSFLRDCYRRTDRNAEVNLAYTILKNKNLRKDYDWMMENHEMIRQLSDIYQHGEKDIGEEEMYKEFFRECIIGDHF